jgi:hypothetical protein
MRNCTRDEGRPFEVGNQVLISRGYGQLLQVNEEIWSGDRLAFRVTALKQQASGTIDASEDHVRLKVTLPW